MQEVDKRMGEKTVIGLDVGGTKVLAACVTSEGTILKAQRYAMDRTSQAAAVRSIETALDDFITRLKNVASPHAIGIGVPGQTAPSTATWVHALNIPIDEPVPLGDLFGSRYGLPVYLDNDVNAAAIAEMKWGRGRNYSDFVYINIGTGIAAGLVSGRRLIRGAANYAGEIGHMSSDAQGRRCRCGGRGCLENTASGGGMIAEAMRRLGENPQSVLRGLLDTGELNAGAIYRAAAEGDRLAQQIAEKAMLDLNTCIVSILNVLNPQAVILGGGVMQESDLAEKLRDHAYRHSMPAVRLSLEWFGTSDFDVNTVGVLGAASLAWEEIR